jgi:RNA polymerase sigma-70 factor (ECF subfamily)
MELLRLKAADIVKSASLGDIASFEQLVILYQDKVYSLSLKLTGSAQDAEDLAQEAFVRAYRYIASFRGDSDFGTWLHRITVNVWLNQKRKKQTKAAYSLDEPIYSDDGEVKREIPDLSQDPESVLLSTQMSEKLHRAVECLPKDQKAVLLLREVEEYSYEEIAGMMACSVGTVKSRLARARDALRRSLNGYSEM